MKMTDESALGVMQFARGYLTWNNMQEFDDALDHIRARLAADQQKGGGEVKFGTLVVEGSHYPTYNFIYQADLPRGNYNLYTTPQPSIPALAQQVVKSLKDRAFPEHECPAESAAVWNTALYEMARALATPAHVPVERLEQLATAWRFDDGYLTGNPKIDGPTIHRGDAKKECANELAALVQEYRHDS